MRKLLLAFLLVLGLISFAQDDSSLYSPPKIHLKKKDRKRDVLLITTDGIIDLRLYDSTPLHRDNFLRLVKSHFYDSILFHRVIQGFMIQGGDPSSKHASPVSRSATVAFAIPFPPSSGKVSFIRGERWRQQDKGTMSILKKQVAEANSI